MGDPSFIVGQPQDVGTSTKSGFMNAQLTLDFVFIRTRQTPWESTMIFSAKSGDLDIKTLIAKI